MKSRTHRMYFTGIRGVYYNVNAFHRPIVYHSFNEPNYLTTTTLRLYIVLLYYTTMPNELQDSF